ncbi:MAG: C-GCAxxG-C-C family (seleno)protein [Halodesulfurarchaeum sp.]
MSGDYQPFTDGGPTSNRRGFLAGAGSVAGLALLGNASALSSKPTDTVPAASDTIDTPLPYTQLDPETAKERGRKFYYAGEHCSQGSFHAILSLLREEVGEPYTRIPSTIPFWSAGGGAGWGAVCGAVVGSNSAISMVEGPTGTTMKLTDELQRWYTQHPFPSYDPPEDAGHITKTLPSATPESILCHVSVTNWCTESGYASGSEEATERCGRLTGETAARAVELLNAQAEGRFGREAKSILPSTVSAENGCRACHSAGTDFQTGQFTRGKMECLNCHTAAPHMPDSLK